MDDLLNIKNKLQKRIGFFGQQYLSLRTGGFELTIDNLTPSERYLVCLCTPYNENLDKRKHKDGAGGGEVKESWIFESENEALKFITVSHLM